MVHDMHTRRIMRNLTFTAYISVKYLNLRFDVRFAFKRFEITGKMGV